MRTTTLRSRIAGISGFLRTTTLGSRIAYILGFLVATRSYFAVLAYISVAVFAVFAIFLALPGISWFETLNTTERFVASIIVVVPPILAMLWDRLSGFKVAGIEFVLARASVKIDDVNLESWNKKLGGTTTPELVKEIKNAMAQEELKLFEVNLGSSPYWWTTRLFLLAALAQEYTNVQRLVFVKNNAQRVFVGMAQPTSVRRVLDKEFPGLEKHFDKLRLASEKKAKQEQVDEIGQYWYIKGPWYDAFVKEHKKEPDPVIERDFAKEVSEQKLCDWLDDELETDARHGGPPSERLYAEILDCKAPFVPLLIGRRLDKVVDRLELVESLAIAAIKEQR